VAATAHHLGADALASEDLEQHGADAAVDDVRLLDAVLQRFEATLDLKYALADRAVGDEPAGVLVGQGLMMEPVASWMPSTSVSRMSFSARSASAILPATRSALML
jgi:hypothetical protein